MSTHLSHGHNLALPAGAVVRDQYRVEAVLGRPGGFGITYLAYDQALDCQVALKEYVPRGLAGRGTDRITIHPHSRGEGDMFRHGLARFMDEARLLARLDHPNIVRVRNFFEANGTAYLVMDYYPGRTLARYLERIGGRLSAEHSVEVMLRVLDGLRLTHSKNLLHRDVKPENIYLTQDGRPILLDFGAARVAVAEMSQKLTTILTPGYAPIEQYSSENGRQGPWTDVYACAAVLYRMIVGVTPPEPFSRLSQDTLSPPRRAVPGLPAHIDDAIMRGLAVQARNRPQTAAEFQDLLEGAPPVVHVGGQGDRGREPPQEPGPTRPVRGGPRSGGRDPLPQPGAPSEKGFFGRLIAGEYGLAKTYWLFGMVVSMVFSFFTTVLGGMIAFSDSTALVLLLVTLVLGFLGYWIVWAIGTWRAASAYEGSAVWAFLAKAAIVFGVLYILAAPWLLSA